MKSVNIFCDIIRSIIRNHLRDIYNKKFTGELSRSLVIGLDCEWKPERRGEKNPVSLLQIAVNDQIFLIDMLALSLSPNISYSNTSDTVMPYHLPKARYFVLKYMESRFMLDVILRFLFRYEHTLIIGLGITSDLTKLPHQSYPNMTAFQHFPSCLDISKLMVSMNNSLFSSMKNGRGLSSLSNEILGFHLNKSQQCSAWHERPFTLSQIEYASLDVLVLLRILENLQIRAKSVPSIPRNNPQIGSADVDLSNDFFTMVCNY